MHILHVFKKETLVLKKKHVLHVLKKIFNLCSNKKMIMHQVIKNLYS